MAAHSAGKYIVGKALEREGMRLEPGTIVDVTGWRNVDKLVTLRYLRPAPRAAIAGLASPEVSSSQSDAIEAAAEPVKKVPAKKAAAKKTTAKKVAE